VRQAVQAALSEALTSPEMAALLAARSPAPQPAPQPAAPREGALARLRRALASARAAAAAGAALAGGWLAAKLTGAVRPLRPAALALWGSRHYLPAALAVGSLAGLGAWLCGPLVASLAAGLLAGAGALAALALRPLWGLLGVGTGA
jgi:hypothetical protein